MILGSSGSLEKRGRGAAEAWRRIVKEMREEDLEDIPAPGSRSYNMARQCLRGRSGCKSREDVGVTPTNSTNSTTPWG
jgi:hypothetical protein